MNKAVAFGLDLVAVLVFVIAGRGAHSEEPVVSGTLHTAAPFWIAAAVAWLVILARRWPPQSWAAGLCVWLVALAGGMLLRVTVFGGGTAVSFVLVAGTVLALFLLGWRALAQPLLRRRGTPTNG